MSGSNSSDNAGESLMDRFHRAVANDTNNESCVAMLEELQQPIASLSLISSNDNDLNDLSTSALYFITLEHYLAIKLINLTTPNDRLDQRRRNLQRACDLFAAFLQRLGQFDKEPTSNDDQRLSCLLTKDERKQYDDLLELQSMLTAEDASSSSSSFMRPTMAPPVNRDVKIARFKQRQAAEKERQRLQALQQRRNRLLGNNQTDSDELDGFDGESLRRQLALTSLAICKVEALEEYGSVLREIPMITMMLQSQAQQGDVLSSSRYGTTSHNGVDPRTRPRPPPSDKPLELTHITQDSTTGELQIRREQIQSQVFRPGWNQPTMSLEELAEREMNDAKERHERQLQAEEAQKGQPRRYEFLKKDGLEDDADLVDASAELDRKWDDWKDENPRGSGNKRGDVGDRNF